MAPVLFILWLAAEVVAVLAVARFVGVWICVLLLIAGWPVGAWLLRAEGRATLRRLRDALATGRAPGPLLADGALALLAGPLFIIPGFVTDLLGLALLVPAVRTRAVGGLTRLAEGRLAAQAARFARGARQPYDVDASAWESRPPSGTGDRPQLHG